MQPKSSPLTQGKTVLEEAVHIVILGMPFDANMTLEKRLPSVSRVATKTIDILRKSLQVFHVKLRLVSYFQGFVLTLF